MSEYTDLADKIGSLRKDVARFYIVVLHTHSVASGSDYGKSFEGKKETEVKDETTYENFVMTCKPDLIAITDHMKCGFACRLSEAASKKGKAILPGMEVNLVPPVPWDNYKVHLVTIFPENSSIECFAKMLPHGTPQESKRTRNTEVKQDIGAFVKEVHSAGGICIAAHIDTTNGVRCTFRQLGKEGILVCENDRILTLPEQQEISKKFNEWLLKAEFDGIEVSRPEYKEYYRWVSEDDAYSVPVLLSNDAHRAEDLDVVARHTHIKMVTPNFDNLKLALKFPDTRIRFPTEVPLVPSPRLLGIQIISGGDSGFFKQLELAFSDNLTCMIGPRGSGKSTIIEAIRYVFGYNRSLSGFNEINADIPKKVKDLQKATLSGCVIRILYVRNDSQTHVLEATFDPKSEYRTRVYTIDGEFVDIPDIEASGAYPLRLFGWSEIETLGREPERQRELLDRLIVDFAPLISQRDGMRHSLSLKKKDILISMEKLATLQTTDGEEIKKYKSYLADFTRLNTPAIDGLFVNIDATSEKLSVLNLVQQNIQAWQDEVQNALNYDIFRGLESVLSEASQGLRDWWGANEFRPKIETAKKVVDTDGEKILRSLEQLLKEATNATKQLTEELAKYELEIKKIIGQEVTKQVAVDLRKSASERLTRVNKLRQLYRDEYKKLEESLKQWGLIGVDYINAQRTISAAREKQKTDIEARLNECTSEGMKISIDLHPGKDLNQFVYELAEGGILKNRDLGHYKGAMLPQKIAYFFNPIEFSKALINCDSTALTKTDKILEVTIEIDKTTAAQLTKTFNPFSRDDDADIPIINDGNLKGILEIADIEWEDSEQILLNCKPVNRLSPGQRSSAMLPLIALAENAPLIIDQPEDNLDNKLVGKVLVDILAKLKEKRQIIVATHNPNIVVSGDAEQVIVLEPKGGEEGVCADSGCIDKQSIVKNVIDIMEGGKEAFLTRKLRYHF